MYTITLENLSEAAVKEVLFGQFFVLGNDFASQDAPLQELFGELQRAATEIAQDKPEFDPPVPEPEYETLAVGDSFIDDDSDEAYEILAISWVPKLRTWLINTTEGDVFFRYPGEVVALENGENVIAPLKD